MANLVWPISIPGDGRLADAVFLSFLVRESVRAQKAISG
jgi:hypothetical protein